MVGKLLRFGSIIAWILRIVVCMGYVISIQNLFNFVHVSLFFLFLSFFFFFNKKKKVYAGVHMYILGLSFPLQLKSANCGCFEL